MKPITELSPEELRAECAEAMGWTRAHSYDGPSDRAWRDSATQVVVFTRHLPNYPADANAALTLAAKLAEKGWRPNMTITLDGQWEAMFSLLGNMMVSYSATATGPHAFPLALCRAFLQVIRSTNPTAQ